MLEAGTFLIILIILVIVIGLMMYYRDRKSSTLNRTDGQGELDSHEDENVLDVQDDSLMETLQE